MRSSKTAKFNSRAIVMPVIVGLMITIVLLLMVSAMIQNGMLNEGSMGAALVIINIIAGFACGMTARSSGRGGGRLNGSIAGLAYAGLIIMVAFLLDMHTPQAAAMGKIIAISLVSSYIGSKINLAKSNKKLRKKRKS